MSVIAKTTRRLSRLAIVESLWVWFVLTSLVVRAVESSVGGQLHGAVDVEDNEFAEFEESDDYGADESTDAPTGAPQPDPGGSADTGGDTEEQAQNLAEPDEFEADADAAIEEDEDDEFSHLEDEEEFENFERSKVGVGVGSGKTPSPSKDKSQGPPPGLKFADVPAHLRSNWSNYQVELLMLVGLGVYLLNYVYGKTRNQALAHYWLDAHRDLLHQQFAVVGDDGVSAEPAEGVMVWEVDAGFSVWCSGRSGCVGMLVQIRLLNRQDLVSIIAQLLRPKYDRVEIRVELEANEMDSFVFAVGQKKSLTKIGKEMLDLSQYCTEKKPAAGAGLPSSFTVLSEIAEATHAMLDPKATSIMSKYEDCIDYLHFSDQYSGPKPQEGETATKLPETVRVLMFNLNIAGKLAASERHIDHARPLLNLVFYYLDKVRRFRLSREGKAKTEKNRQCAQESFLKTTHAQRQEAAQQRREDKIRERKERLMNEEDPDKQRRLEKQEQKREAKRKQPKMKQLKIKAM